MARPEIPMIKVERIEICRNCQGAGQLKYPTHAVDCEVCEGSGKVLVRKEIKITILTIK